MQKISGIAMMAILMFFISSCTEEKLVRDDPGPISGKVVFILHAEKNMVYTKVTNDDEQNIRTVGVFIVKENGNLAEGIERFYESKDLTGHKLAISIPVEMMNSVNNKAYLIANWGDKMLYETVKTEKELLDLIADTKPEEIATKGIPMACEAIALNFTGGVATVDANMKRVMSTLYTKVMKEKSIIASPKDFTFKLHGVSNKKGYCFKDECKDTGENQEWTSASGVLDEEVPLGYFYQSNPIKIEVISKLTSLSHTIEIPAEKAKMRNKKYVLKIQPKPLPEGKGDFNVTLEEWEGTEIYIDFGHFNLVDFEPSVDFEAKGIKWNEATRTLDITNATEASVLKFNAKGATHVKTNIVSLFNKNASSIGGEKSLADILKIASPTEGNIAFNVNIPVQTLKVPLDILVSIQNSDNDESETITIKSRPDYAGTGIQPVMMKTTDNKLVFWAPINVGATKIPESVPTTDNTDITESCGKLFQWGRKSGVAATNNPATTDAEKFDGKTDPLGFPKGEGTLAYMSKWDGKFIISSSYSPNTQHNWLLFDAFGADNPAYAVPGAWYQKLWNSGTEEAPIKTEYDPCPEGWRIPTEAEWRAIGQMERDMTVPGSWDYATRLLSLPGTESGQKLILPAAGTRGWRLKQCMGGAYWSATPSANCSFSILMLFGSIDHDATITHIRSVFRASAMSVRCIQE